MNRPQNRADVYASLVRMATEMSQRYCRQAALETGPDRDRDQETAALYFAVALELPEIERRTRPETGDPA